MINIISELDKENTSLKETNKMYQDNFKASKVFLDCFEKEIRNCSEKNKALELKNSNLIAEIEKFNKNKKV